MVSRLVLRKLLTAFVIVTMMKAVTTSETSVNFNVTITLLSIPEDGHLASLRA
jgi:hypothetical protein